MAERKRPKHSGIAEAQPPYSHTWEDADEWYPVEPREFLRAVAVDNIASFTDGVDFCRDKKPMVNATGERLPLASVTPVFVDNFILRTITPAYQVVYDSADPWRGGEKQDNRRRRSGMLGSILLRLREDMEAFTLEDGSRPFADLTGIKLKPVGIAPFTKRDAARVASITKDRGREWAALCHDYTPAKHAEDTPLFWQSIMVSCPDADMATVLAYIRAGSYAGSASRCFFSNVDLTIDAEGVVARSMLLESLVHKGLVVSKQWTAQANHVIDQESNTGAHCLSWNMATKGEDGQSYRCRHKSYTKLVDELETGPVRSKIGNNIFDWLCSANKRLLAARDATTMKGLTRTEVTVYFGDSEAWGDDSCVAPPFDQTHTAVGDIDWAARIAARSQDQVPADAVFACSHKATIQTWMDQLCHTLIVYDSSNDIGLVAYSLNRTTGLLSGTYVTKWATVQEYAVQHMSLGTLPIDVVGIDRGRNVGRSRTATSTGRCGMQVTKEVWEDDAPKAPLVPLEHESMLNLKRKYDSQGERIQQRFPTLVSKAYENPVQETVDKEAGSEAEGSEEGSEKDSEEWEVMEEVEEQVEEQAEEREEEAEEREEQEAEMEAGGEGDFCASSCRSIAPAKQMPFGQLRVTSTRFHRFPFEHDATSVSTRFTAADRPGIASCVNPSHITLAQLKASKKPTGLDELLRANQEEATRNLVMSGLGSVSMQVELPHLPFVASRANKDYSLVQCESFLPPNLDAVLVPKRFGLLDSYSQSFTATRAARKPTPAKWLADQLATLERAASERRIQSAREGNAERAYLQLGHTEWRTLYNHCDAIKAMATKDRLSLLDVVAGDYTITGVYENSHKHSFLAVVDPRTNTTLVVEIGVEVHPAISQSMADRRRRVLTETGQNLGTFYVDMQHLSSGANLGILRKGTTGQKWCAEHVKKTEHLKGKRLHSSLICQGGVSKICTKRVDFQLFVGGKEVYASGAASKAGRNEALSCASDKEPIPTFTQEDLPGNNLKLVQEFTEHYKKETQLYVNILAAAQLAQHRRKVITVLKCQRVGEEGHRFLWAPPDGFEGLEKQLYKGCRLYAVKTTNRGITGASIIGPEDWIVPTREHYQALPTIDVGDPGGAILVKDFKPSVDRKGEARWVLRDRVGKAWRFTKHGKEKQLIAAHMRAGCVLNTDTWTVTHP